MFIYKKWENFCRELDQLNVHSITAASLIDKSDILNFIILKHDVETNPIKSLKMAKIESKYGHKGSYYVQAYLLNNIKNIDILKKISELGHEVSYHHDVMDSNSGDMISADIEFFENLNKFRLHGFEIKTVCQHGNPVIKRQNYYSNRDFFRNNNIAEKYNDIAEIMWNFKEKSGYDYIYVSDSGYNWQIIYNPENNDITNSDDKNIQIGEINNLVNIIKEEKNIVISTHPHRWQSNVFVYYMRIYIFAIIKKIVKFMIKIPILNKIFSKYYYIAKKI